MWDFHGTQGAKPEHISRELYDRMIASGAFEEKKIELLQGVIVQVSPQGTEHMAVIRKLITLLSPLIVGRALLHVQGPIALSADSEPEPDVALVAPGEYSDDHPSMTFLIVEVAASSLAKDKGWKAELYAQANQPEYWVVDLERRRVIVHRNPQKGVYADLATFADGQSIALLQFPDVALAVSEILPRLSKP